MQIISFLKKNLTFWGIMVVFGFILGFYSLQTIDREATPSINIPIYVVSIIYPGADPSAIDKQVMNVLESRMRSIPGVMNVTASSTFNVGVLSIEFSENVDPNDASNEIKNVVDQVHPTLPSAVKVPVVRKVDFADQPIFIFAIAGNLPSLLMYEYANTLEEELRGLPGVSEVTIVGKPQQTIQILFDYNSLVTYGLDVSFVLQQLQNSFIDVSVDKKAVDGQLYTFNISNIPDSLEKLRDNISNLTILAKDGKTVKVSDLGDVLISPKALQQESYVYNESITGNAVNTLSFQIKKIPGADIQQVSNSILGLVEDFDKKNDKFTINQLFSQKESTDQTYSNFINSFWQTGLQVFLVILLFLGFRSGFVSLLGFVLVYAITFIVLKATGETFNNITSFSLILVLGIMVDNLVIIVEGTVEKLREGGKDIFEAIGYSLKKYAIPIVTGTLATVLVFLPIQFSLSGIIGQFMRSFPVTVNLTLLISLFVTIILLPVIIIYLIRVRNDQEPQKRKFFEIKGLVIWQNYQTIFGRSFWGLPYINPDEAIEKVQKMGDRFAQVFKNWTTSKRRARYVLWFFRGLFVFSIFLLGSGALKVDFLGNVDTQNVWINIKYNPGMSLEKNKKLTNELGGKLTKFLEKYSYGIESLAVNIGSSRSQEDLNAGGDSSNQSYFTIRLYEQSKVTPSGKKRAYTSYKMTEEIQKWIDQNLKDSYKDIEEISAFTNRAGPSSGKPVGFYILGDDLGQIGEYIGKILPEIKQIPGLYNIVTSAEYTNGRISYKIDMNEVRNLNVNPLSFAQLFAGIKNSSYWPNGLKITEFKQFGDDPVELIGFVNYQGNTDNLTVNGISIDNITENISLEPEIKTISRIDGKRAISVGADLESGIPLGEIIPQINKILEKNPLPDGLTYKTSSEIETQDDSMGQLGQAMLLGLFLMFLLLVLEFKNVRYPLIIIHSTFLSIAGAIILLWLLGFSFSFPAQLGIFGVIGVGVNQSIVIIDYLEDLLHNGEIKSFKTVLLQAISRRFVPIFITNATGILGVIGVIFSDEIFGSLGIAFMGGLILSVFIGMWYVPAMILLFAKEEGKYQM